MGRMAAYLGPSSEVARIVEGGSSSLMSQSAEHPDAFGMGWYPPDEDESPILLRNTGALGRQAHLMEVPQRATTECVVASVQRVEEPPAALADCQPYRYENLLFAHDGHLGRFAEVFATPLRQALSPRCAPLVRGNDPSELLFATWIDALGVQRGPDAMATALEQMVAGVQDIATREDTAAEFACVVTDGTCLITLRTATHGTPPPLYTIVADEEAPVPMSGRVVASEPLFKGAWTALDPHSLVIFTVESDEDTSAQA